MTADSTLGIIVYPLSTLIFVLLSQYSLQFHIRINGVDREQKEIFLQSLRFPFSAVRWFNNNDELKDFLVPRFNNKVIYILIKIILYMYILPLYVELLLNVWSSANLVELILNIMWILVYTIGIVSSWNFGKNIAIKQNEK